MNAEDLPPRLQTAAVLLGLAMGLILIFCLNRFSRRPRPTHRFRYNSPIKRL